MIFISVAFDYEDTQYIRLGKVLEKSVKFYCPSIPIKFLTCKPPIVPEDERALMRFGENTEKLRLWVKLLKEIEDEHIILIDSDMMVLNDISFVFDEDFDIGATLRAERARIPYNGGVMFVKKNERSIKFFEEFEKINNKMYNDREFHKKWREKYAGMNQAAFGYMVENYEGEIKIKNFPCKEFNNCCPDSSKFLKEKPKIVHIKGVLRDVCLGKIKDDKFSYVSRIWKEIEERQ